MIDEMLDNLELHDLPLYRKPPPRLQVNCFMQLHAALLVILFCNTMSDSYRSAVDPQQ